MCTYFMRGLCNRGSNCLFSHSLHARPPACRFFSSFQGCRNGDSCHFSHDLGPQVLSSELCVPEGADADAKALVKLFPKSSDGRVLLLDDLDLQFSAKFSQHYDPSRIISTTSLSETSIFDAALSGVNIMWGIQHPFRIFSTEVAENCIPWDKVRCVFWFPNFDGYDESSELQKCLVQNFFEHLAIRILGDTLFDVHIILIMNNIRFSHLQVEKLGRECFFFLTESFPFDESSFGELRDTMNTKRRLAVSSPISYVFELHPPTDLQFGDYTAAFHARLHGSQ